MPSSRWIAPIVLLADGPARALTAARDSHGIGSEMSWASASASAAEISTSPACLRSLPRKLRAWASGTPLRFRNANPVPQIGSGGASAPVPLGTELGDGEGASFCHALCSSFAMRLLWHLPSVCHRLAAPFFPAFERSALISLAFARSFITLLCEINVSATSKNLSRESRHFFHRAGGSFVIAARVSSSFGSFPSPFQQAISRSM